MPARRRVLEFRALGCLVGGFDAVPTAIARTLARRRKGNPSVHTRHAGAHGIRKKSPISASCWDCWRSAPRNARRRRKNRKP